MSSEKEAFPIFLDEYQLPKSDRLGLLKLQRSTRIYRGWLIGEPFDERYVTEVGGVQRFLVQAVDERGFIVDPSKHPAEEMFKASEPTIWDYKTGEVFGQKEAESKPELAPVLKRLKERVVEYNAFLAKTGLTHQNDNQQEKNDV